MNLNVSKKIAIVVLFAFLVNTFGPLPSAHADDFVLPPPGVMVRLSPEFNPPILKGIKVHPENPFRFDFILDRGDGQLSNDALKDESSKLIKYFLASLTIPEKDLWVNLSPYEKDRIIPQSFGLTEMGRDLLAEDYMLKQITASLIYPEDEVGRKFWKRIYEEASKRFGTTNIPVNTFNKVWIVPEKAIVYENAKAGTAYVVESKLKVMLEQDYLSLQKHEGIKSQVQSQDKTTNQLGSQIVREIVIPQLTKEVNENKNFSQLRQVYNSLILATWYKKKIKDSILEQVYADKNKVAGVNIDDPQEKHKIYERYLQAFKKGVYNYIKEEQDLLTQQVIPRKYFSGGAVFEKLPLIFTSNFAMVTGRTEGLIQEEVRFDAAMQATPLPDWLDKIIVPFTQDYQNYGQSRVEEFKQQFAGGHVISDDEEGAIIESYNHRAVIRVSKLRSKRFFLDGHWLMTLDPSDHMMEEFGYDRQWHLQEVTGYMPNGGEFKINRAINEDKEITLVHVDNGPIILSIYKTLDDLFNEPGLIPGAQGGEYVQESSRGVLTVVLGLLARALKDKNMGLRQNYKFRYKGDYNTPYIFRTLREVAKGNEDVPIEKMIERPDRYTFDPNPPERIFNEKYGIYVQVQEGAVTRAVRYVNGKRWHYYVFPDAHRRIIPNQKGEFELQEVLKNGTYWPVMTINAQGEQIGDIHEAPQVPQGPLALHKAVLPNGFSILTRFNEHDKDFLDLVRSGRIFQIHEENGQLKGQIITGLTYRSGELERMMQIFLDIINEISSRGNRKPIHFLQFGPIFHIFQNLEIAMPALIKSSIYSDIFDSEMWQLSSKLGIPTFDTADKFVENMGGERPDIIYFSYPPRISEDNDEREIAQFYAHLASIMDPGGYMILCSDIHVNPRLVNDWPWILVESVDGVSVYKRNSAMRTAFSRENAAVTVGLVSKKASGAGDRAMLGARWNDDLLKAWFRMYVDNGVEIIEKIRLDRQKLVDVLNGDDSNTKKKKELAGILKSDLIIRLIRVKEADLNWLDVSQPKISFLEIVLEDQQRKQRMDVEDAYKYRRSIEENIGRARGSTPKPGYGPLLTDQDIQKLGGILVNQNLGLILSDGINYVHSEPVWGAFTNHFIANSTIYVAKNDGSHMKLMPQIILTDIPVEGLGREKVIEGINNDLYPSQVFDDHWIKIIGKHDPRLLADFQFSLNDIHRRQLPPPSEQSAKRELETLFFHEIGEVIYSTLPVAFKDEWRSLMTTPGSIPFPGIIAIKDNFKMILQTGTGIGSQDPEPEFFADYFAMYFYPDNVFAAYGEKFRDTWGKFMEKVKNYLLQKHRQGRNIWEIDDVNLVRNLKEGGQYFKESDLLDFFSRVSSRVNPAMSAGDRAMVNNSVDYWKAQLDSIFNSHLQLGGKLNKFETLFSYMLLPNYPGKNEDILYKSSSSNAPYENNEITDPEIFKTLGPWFRKRWREENLDGHPNQYLARFPRNYIKPDAFPVLMQRRNNLLQVSTDESIMEDFMRYWQTVYGVLHLRFFGPHVDRVNGQYEFIDNDFIAQNARQFLKLLVEHENDPALNDRPLAQEGYWREQVLTYRDLMLWGLVVMLDPLIHDYMLEPTAQYAIPSPDNIRLAGLIRWPDGPDGPQGSMNEFLQRILIGIDDAKVEKILIQAFTMDWGRGRLMALRSPVDALTYHSKKYPDINGPDVLSQVDNPFLKDRTFAIAQSQYQPNRSDFVYAVGLPSYMFLTELPFMQEHFPDFIKVLKRLDDPDGTQMQAMHELKRISLEKTRVLVSRIHSSGGTVSLPIIFSDPMGSVEYAFYDDPQKELIKKIFHSDLDPENGKFEIEPLLKDLHREKRFQKNASALVNQWLRDSYDAQMDLHFVSEDEFIAYVHVLSNTSTLIPLEGVVFQNMAMLGDANQENKAGDRTTTDSKLIHSLSSQAMTTSKDLSFDPVEYLSTLKEKAKEAWELKQEKFRKQKEPTDQELIISLLNHAEWVIKNRTQIIQRVSDGLEDWRKEHGDEAANDIAIGRLTGIMNDFWGINTNNWQTAYIAMNKLTLRSMQDHFLSKNQWHYITTGLIQDEMNELRGSKTFDLVKFHGRVQLVLDLYLLNIFDAVAPRIWSDPHGNLKRMQELLDLMNKGEGHSGVRTVEKAVTFLLTAPSEVVYQGNEGYINLEQLTLLLDQEDLFDYLTLGLKHLGGHLLRTHQQVHDLTKVRQQDQIDYFMGLFKIAVLLNMYPPENIKDVQKKTEMVEGILLTVMSDPVIFLGINGSMLPLRQVLNYGGQIFDQDLIDHLVAMYSHQMGPNAAWIIKQQHELKVLEKTYKPHQYPFEFAWQFFEGQYFDAWHGLNPKNRETSFEQILSSNVLTPDGILPTTFHKGSGFFSRSAHMVVHHSYQQITAKAAQHYLATALSGLKIIADSQASSSAMTTRPAMIANGGIDLTSANMHLQTQNSNGEIKFHLDPTMLKQLQNAPGFVPVVISIEPLRNLRGFLTGG